MARIPFGKQREALLPLGTAVRVSVDAHQDIAREGDRPSSVTLLLAGFACRYKLVSDGKRQITSFHIPGDMPDLSSLLHSGDGPQSLQSCALGAGRDSSRRHARPFHEQPQVAHLFWRDTLIDAAVFCEWMVGIGRRSAFTRVAHLFCELIVRMQAVGLSLGLQRRAAGDAD